MDTHTEAMRPRDRKYATDLITFYHPDAYGLTTEQFRELGVQDPRRLWMRILDQVALAGLSAFEMTFPPADWSSAIRAFGSAAAFKEELDARGLSVFSGFHVPDWSKDATTIVRESRPYIEFLKEAGSEIIVVGPPHRSTLGSEPPSFADLDRMKQVADVLNLLGHFALSQGVRVAVHTEAHTVCYLKRDIELLMLLTDPDYVWLCPDSSHISLGGGQAARVVEPFQARILISHWKDATGPVPRDMEIDANIFRAHEPYMANIGEGVVDWPAWAAVMAKTPHADVILVELDRVPRPVEAMHAAIAFLDPLLDERRDAATF